MNERTQQATMDRNKLEKKEATKNKLRSIEINDDIMTEASKL